MTNVSDNSSHPAEPVPEVPIGLSPQSQSTQSWWERISGAFLHDDAFDRIEQIGRELRNSYTDSF